VSSYSLSNRADEDLQRIYLDSIRYFGVSQAAKYKLELDRCFEKLAELPRLGREAPGIGRSVRRHEHGSHIIFYRESNDGVVILALVHGKRKYRPKL